MPDTLKRAKYTFRTIALFMGIVIIVGCSNSPQSPQTANVSTQAPTLAPTASNPALAPTQTTAQVASAADLTGPQPRGYLTTHQELLVVKAKADQNIEPYKSAVDNVMSFANKDWDFRLAKNVTCKDSDNPAWLDNNGGIPILNAKALAYNLTGDTKYAEDAKNILQRIMTEVATVTDGNDFPERQCQLNLSWGTPELVASADLIEHYWYDKTCTGPLATSYGDTTIGSGKCKVLFQNWLIKIPYYIDSKVAEGSKSNWGASSTNTTAYIADYLWDRPNQLLTYRHRSELNDGENTTITPHDAYIYANKLMIERMNGYGVDYGSNTCDELKDKQQSDKWPPVKSQISERGIIPEDARREESCNIPEYSGKYENYPQLHIGSNVQQCELMLRRGDSSCYDNIDNTDIPKYTYTDGKGNALTTHLYPGRGSLERAINAIIVDSNTPWKHTSALEVAYHYYYSHHRSNSMEQWRDQLDGQEPGGCSQDICFGTLTHGFAPDEQPSMPPTISPP